MAEIPAGGLPFRKDINARALRVANRGPSKVKGALIRVGAALGLVASGGAIEATAHPIQNTIDTTKTTIEQGAHNVQDSKEALVSFYNKDAEIQKYNEEASARLSGKTPLLEGEQIFEKIKVVPAGENYAELLQMKDEKGLVNIRNFPSTYTPTGNPTEVLGALPQGAEITHVIRVNVYQPNSQERGEWYGFLWKSPDAGENEPYKMSYVYGIYGQPESPNVATNSTPSTNTP